MASLKARLKAWLRPLWLRATPLRNAVLLVRIYLYDYRRFRRHYVPATARKTKQDELGAWLLQDKHRIEKGLSFAQVKPNYGQPILERLLHNLLHYQQQFGKDAYYYWGVGAFAAYQQHHQQQGIATAAWFDQLIAQLPAADLAHSTARQVGTQALPQHQLKPEQFAQFFNSRTSVRQFQAQQPVPQAVLEAIVATALKTPSVCNRQHWKLHILSGAAKDQALALQNGNTGFGHDAPQVGIVTSSLRAFSLPAERAQAYTDGGMFAMSLLLAAHAHQVATCPLNWAASLKQDLELRKLQLINDDETVIMLIALGYASPNCVIANSPRKPVADILIVHDGASQP